MNMRDCNPNMPPRRPMSGQQSIQCQPPMSGQQPMQCQPPMSGQQPMQGCRPLQTREALMRQLDEASFALDDVQLFLDTHPNDAAAMQYYRNAAAMRRNAMDAYQNQFGPLMSDSVNGNSWDWVTEKWPWEGGC